MADPSPSSYAHDPAIDVLPDEILHLIVAVYVDDPKDLGACLLAWRRFHVLTDADLVAQRCRFSTLLSLCAAGDLGGLHYAAVRPDVFGPVPGFRWDACLYAATVGDHVDVLDHLKSRIIKVAATLPPARDLDPEPATGLHVGELRAIRLAAQNPTVDPPTWPPSPASWLALAVAAAHRGCERALAWLCAEDNRPAQAPTPQCVLSAHETTRFGYKLSGDGLLWLRMRLDGGVLSMIKRAARTMDEAAMRAVAERVSAASGLDVVGLFQRSVENITDDAGEAVSVFQTLDRLLGRPKEMDPMADQLVHEAMADPSSASADAVNAAWAIVARGGLTALRAQYGDEAVAVTLNRHPFYPAQILGLFAVMVAPYADSPLVDFADTDLPWPSLCDDAMWLFREYAAPSVDRDPIVDSVVVPMLCVMMALAGRRDLMDGLGSGAGSASDEPSAAGRSMLSNIGHIYTCVAVAAVNRGDLTTARWACARMDSTRALTPWTAWCAGRAEAARFLYAHGCDRAPSVAEVERYRDACAESPLYVSMCARDTEAVDALLDPTAADDSYREAVDRAISAAVTRAVDEALAAGNLRVVMWLHRRYPDLVNMALAEARATRTPLLVPIHARAPRP
ncbi:hypothetical protein pdul_cds_1037 [Pandoravirus dulcis]|uniref:Uncharacterized protein n=1 Tax=Pandoravirus dulcis TaxID=1349409 RepID=S4VZ36_9VIRU|nr:hypothetical protein pdul_cds_1037 [Pandoravirus dulcis]AGO83311.1 hypothetical protein pdul_cds_1037 [Pandoravirus dulcis]